MKPIDLNTVLVLAFAAMAGLLAPAPAWAMDYHWIGAGTGGNMATDPADPTTQWNNPANWQEGSLPGPADSAYLPLANAGYVNAQTSNFGGLVVDGLSSEGALRIGDGVGIGTAYGVAVADQMRGRLVQEGGAFTVGTFLSIGGSSLGDGAYVLQAGNLTVTTFEEIGLMGKGAFTQTGGTHVVKGTVYVGRTGPNAAGVLAVGPGNLSANSIQVGGALGSGAFQIKNASATVQIEWLLALGPASTFEAVPGSAIKMAGGAPWFQTSSKDESALADLDNLTLVFEGDSRGWLGVFEVAGMDLGPVKNGFEGNFTLGSLVLGDANPARVRLADDYDNGNRTSGEALYVHDLTVGPGSVLDLAGLHVYYDGTYTDYGTILGGSPICVPEPATCTILALAASLVAAGKSRWMKRNFGVLQLRKRKNSL